MVREAVGQHALGYRARPLEQDVARLIDAIGGEADPAQRDECVPAPVCEPGVAGDNRLSRSALHQIGVSSAVKRGVELSATLCLGLANLLKQGQGIPGSGLTRAEDQCRFAVAKVPCEFTGRRQVFGAVEPAVTLDLVTKVPIPVWLMTVVAVGRRMNVGDPVVRPPDETTSCRFRFEAECAVLVMQGVVVAP